MKGDSRDFRQKLATKIQKQAEESGMLSGIDQFCQKLEDEILNSVQDSTGCILYMRDRPSVTWDWEEDYIDGQDWSPLEHKVLNEVWNQILARLPVKNNEDVLRNGCSETFYMGQEEFNQCVDEYKLTARVELVLGLKPQVTCIKIGFGLEDEMGFVDISGLTMGLSVQKIHQSHSKSLYTLDLGEDNAKYRFQLIDFNQLIQK